MCLGQIADAHGDQIGALGNDLGCGHAFLVLQGDGIVRWVHHHKIGLGDGGDAGAIGDLALALAHATLDLGVAVRFLVFLLDFLVRHLEPLAKEDRLQRHIHQGRQKTTSSNSAMPSVSQSAT
jgi:hypothetical protein